jgi:amidase
VVPFPSDGVSTWSGMSEFGPLATTVADLGLALDVLAGTGGYRAVAPPDRPLRVGYSAKPPAAGVKVHPEVRAAMEAVAQVLADAGHQVEATGPPWRPAGPGGRALLSRLPEWAP